VARRADPDPAHLDLQRRRAAGRVSAGGPRRGPARRPATRRSRRARQDGPAGGPPRRISDPAAPRPLDP
jgi:hypothetical protein